MKKTAFIETIKVTGGQFVNLPLHVERLMRSVREVYGVGIEPGLSEVRIPEVYRTGTVKCRVTYTDRVEQVDFEFYRPKQVHSLKVIDGVDIDYSRKYADRTGLIALSAQKGKCDEILIACGGMVTDTSYSNIVLFDGETYVTPETCLLNGTKRRLLLEKGKIEERSVSVGDLKYYERLYLINAMLDIEDGIVVETGNIDVTGI